MEKIENRIKYLGKLNYFLNSVKLTEEFYKALKTHTYFEKYMRFVEDLPEREKTLFVLLELTRERSTCNTIIKLLSDSGQCVVAEYLREFNKSSGPMKMNWDEVIEVNKAIAPKQDMSNNYNLIKNPRGKAIIINTVEEPQSPSVYDDNGLLLLQTKGLALETKRFAHIFKELHFEVILKPKLSAQQMLNTLTDISRETNIGDGDAFVLMVITHGENEQVFGYNACEAMRKVRFGEINKDSVEVKGELERDVVGIKDIISIFSNDNCKALIAKPKLFFFTCCRIESEFESTDSPQLKAIRHNKRKVERLGLNQDTYVSYACAQGFRTYFDQRYGISYFGQALSHSIAQYACEESLSFLMSRTSKRLRELYEQCKQEEEEEYKNGGPKPQLHWGSFAIELNSYDMERQVDFNPGVD